ncbi:5'-3' exoribonuclease 1 [Fistulifera solaris]|uniref:proteasome endopeptidase complex n=1 Tax=Fistulifera solaris TaxID=1519565 RepID=A0A1Z5J6T6_FISSO|nr:5'-3' exoribonuclease 1 [Fistulifera solaris]|eukprot:GAX09715.1 5'-3' exoribonuclease 1 [Fistulifera solaris]
MGVPKFFRWLSERYPRIIQRHGSRPTDATCQEHFGKPPPDYLPPPDPLSECGLAPEIDRLYIDMNGIIHGCSHNNADLELNPDAEGEADISEEEIFRNVSYYLDRIIKDIAQPKELVYMAIDGVAPRAKLNQQRARRYRSGQEGEIEQTVYDAHIKAMEREQAEMDKLKEAKERDSQEYSADGVEKVKEIQPGRFTGKFETFEGSSYSESAEGDKKKFHSNTITPGTEFFQRCTDYLEQFIKDKVDHDPAWQNLTIVFSGPHVPGEGEHKIMQFMREQQAKDDYNPNLRHCIVGQDGDLVMLGLATHEPNLVLLREQVVFSKRALQAERLSQKYGLDMYIHNPNFEFMHMNLLRDYLALEFRTSNVIPNSSFDLEHTVDDFVFMTFLVGNDFLPHMPAMDIADEAFDLIFFTYRELRKKWLRQSNKRPGLIPYLTHEGNIVSGRRLEEFLTLLGQHELYYYDYKKTNENLEETRRVEDKYGYDFTPSDDVIVSKEESDRARFREMIRKNLADEASDVELQTPDQAEFFAPVLSGPLHRRRTIAGDEPGVDGEGAGLFTRMGSLLQYSIASDDSGSTSLQIDDQDVKGRYYYDKFGFSPFDAEKHVALRKAYIEGLVWNLKYYYEGCVSWEWYYPYHYGPMLSDLVGLEKILKDISFEGKMGEPLKPFEQLMACMPPSHAKLLPEPYRPLMTDENSPIASFYPRTFTIDMNGKRWPWEAVVLLPFIDSKRLIEAAKSVDSSLLSQEELNRNRQGEPVVFQRLADGRDASTESKIEVTPLSSSFLHYAGKRVPLFRPKLKDGIQVPLGGRPTLCDGLVESVMLRSVHLNVHGMQSRYKTACLELRNEALEVLPAETIAPHMIGTVIYIDYPHLTEAFVTAVSDQQCIVRGNKTKRPWSLKEAADRKIEKRRLMKKFFFGDQLPGSGGISFGKLDSMMEIETVLHVRPLRGLETLSDGRVVKTFAKFEVEVPLFVTSFLPSEDDKRLAGIPVKLEEDPFYSTKTLVGKRMLKGEEDADQASKRLINVPGAFSYTMRRPIKIRSRAFHSGAGGVSFQSNFSTVSNLPFGSKGRAERPNARMTLNSNLSQRAALRPNYLGARHTSLGCSKGFSLCLVIGLSFFANAYASIVGPLSNEFFASSPPVRSQFPKMTEDASDYGLVTRSTPPLEFEHGTTTISFLFQGGIIAAVDSRASLGSFIGSKTVQKVLPINSHMIGTMAGGAADCSYWIRLISQEALFYELSRSRRISVTRVATLLSNALYENRNLGLSVGTMIMGYDDDKASPPKIFYVDDSGARISGDMFAVGSGSTFALGILDTERKYEMTVEEAIDLGIKAIRHATFRDAYSGGFINVFLITRNKGWRRVYSEDLSRFLRDPSSGNRIPLEQE